MTEEEKDAIKQLKSWREYIVKNREKVNKCNDIEFYLRTALNLIQNQQSELEKKEHEHRDLELKYEQNLKFLKHFRKELNKKDKIIDKMAEYLASIDFDEHCAEIPDICMRCPKEDDLDGYMQCIKQYFERKVK